MKPSLILVPGLMCDETVWEPQMAALRELVDDIQVANNGARDSLVAMAQAIIARAPPRFAIAGHSMGGRVALEVVRRVPERIAGVALLDTGYQPRPPGEPGEREAAGRFTLLRLARRDGMRAMGREWVRGMVHPARLQDEKLIGTILDMIERKTPELFEAQIHALLSRPDAADILPDIRCPTLVLVGEDDTWATVRRHREMHAVIPGSTLAIVANCGHMSTLERPLELATLLRTWLESTLS